MTSSKLADILSGYRFVGEKQIQFSPDNVYDAGSLAQKELCNRLRLLERICTHIAVAQTERYQYQAITITGAANNGSGLIRITATSHGFQTGDSVVIGSVVGTTEANNTTTNPQWTITRITANTFDLVGSTFTNTYTSGGTAYHALWAAIQIRSGRQTSPSIYPYQKKDPDWIELHRQDWADPSDPNNQSTDTSKVTMFYEIYDDPIILGMMNMPNASVTSEFRFYRQPFPHEDLSATVNPLIPGRYDPLMIQGTEYWMHKLRAEQVARDYADKVLRVLFDEKIAEAIASKAKDRLILDTKQEALEW